MTCEACQSDPSHVAPGKTCYACGTKGPDIPPPIHLGDGVYATCQNGMILLTTGHHDPTLADNTVYLEPQVYNALLCYGKKVWPTITGN